MARISVDSSAVSHNKNGEGGGGVTYVMGGNGGSGSYNSLTVQSINAANGNIDYLKSKSISANDMSMVYISAVDGTIQKLKGNELKYNQGYISAFNADTIEAGKLKVDDIDAINAWIDTLQSKEITTEYLTVTKQAHFFELVIDKIRSVGGQLIITPASCVVDYVHGIDSNNNLVDPDSPDAVAFDVYWRTEQDDGRSVTNDFIVNDQVMCQSFNNAHEGTNYNISNKYYWRLVKQVSGITSGYDDIYVNLATGALTTDPNASLRNEFEVVMYKTTSILNNVAYDNNISWECKAQTIDGIETNVSWTNGTLGADEVVHGMFKSASQLYGIQIEPTITENLPATTNFQLQIKQIVDSSYKIPDKINIGVYFTDDSFLMWNDVQLDDNGNFFFNIPDTNSAIRAIIVTSTADVKWHKCHRIRVSNESGEYDDKNSASHIDPAERTKYSSIPSVGDNLVQLGYQGNDDTNRQSAIIIAAYKTPDQGGRIDADHIIPPVYAPSYAQYMGINDFNLYTHRGTYIDATGGYFKGKLVSSSGTVYDMDDKTLDPDFYKIIPDYDVITVEEEVINPSSLTVNFLSSKNTNLLTTVPTECVFQYSINGGNTTTLPAGAAVSIDISGMSEGEELLMKLKEAPQVGTKVYDTVKMVVAELISQVGPTGQNGSYNQWAYKNAVTGPSAPTSDSTYPPSGWTGEPSTPDFSIGEYTWCTDRKVTFDSNNNPVYGNWCTPYRITGDNGRAGEDGKFTEFIYKHTTGPWSPSGADDPVHWDNSTGPDAYGRTFPDEDYLGPTGAGWTDNPQGIGTIDNTFYKYEYMSQRRYNGTGFDSFSEPKIWSSYGEKGQDGDGYEYIFCRDDSETGPTGAADPTTWGPTSAADAYGRTWPDDDYLGPSGTNWTDDPQGVEDVTGHKKEWVATRKKTNGEWGSFSSAALWAQFVPPGAQGQNGQYSQWAYKNAITGPSAPTSDSTYPPSGWTGEPSTPDFEHGEYTWETVRTITFDTNNTPVWGNWCTPYRISGDNGRAGEDGKYTEFIYKHTTGPWSPSGADDPEHWDASTGPDSHGRTFPDEDYIGPSGAGWTDNPEGVNSTYPYEYMTSRRFNGTTFESFTEPKIWSSFGIKGRDGDGYEYIFKTFAQEQTWGATGNENPANWPANQDDEYYGPTGAEWSDDPLTLDETNNKFEYVSVRKKKYDSTQDKSVWGLFSTPEIWAMYGGQGPQGPTGPMGPTGPAGGTTDQYFLVPLTELFEVRIDAEQVGAEAYENISGVIYTELEYGVVHKDGTNITYLSTTDLANYDLAIISNCAASGEDNEFFASDYSGYIGTSRLNKGESFEIIGTLKFKANNILSLMWPNNSSAGYRDYYNMHVNNHIDRAPLQLNIALMTADYNVQLDQTCLDLIFKPSHLFSVGDTALNSIYQGLSGTNNRYTQTGMSSIKQTWDNIKFSVNNLRYANSGDLQDDTDIEQYIYYRNNSTTAPNTPVSNPNTWATIPSGWVQKASYPTPTESNKYVWISQRTRTVSIASDGSLSYGTPTSWSDPELFDKYGVNRRGTVNSAQLDIAADRIASTVTSQVMGNVSDAVMNGKTFEIDLRYDALTAAGLSLSSIGGTKASGDSSSNYKAEAVFIPVGINFNTDKGKSGAGWDILIERNFDRDLGYPYYSDHKHTGGGTTSDDADTYADGDGFEYAMAWHTVGSGYGTTWAPTGTRDNNGFCPNEKNAGYDDANYGADEYRYIIQNENNYTINRTYTYNGTSYSIPQDLIGGSIRQDAFNTIELVYLRGGSKYRIHTDNFEATVQVYATGYDITSGGVRHKMPVIYPNALDQIISPVLDRMKRSEIEQTAERISLSVMELDGVSQEQLKRTGIDITSGKIELTADNTIINGNLNVIESGQTGEQEGITLYDSDNNARVNILANNIPDPTDPNSTFSAYNSFNIESDWTTKTTSDNVNITTSKKAIGSFSNGSTLTMYIYPTITGYVNGSTSIVNNVPGTISCTLNLYKDGGSTISNYTTQSINVASSNPRHYPRTIFTISNLAAGSYEAEINITGDDSTNRYVNYKIICDTSFYKLSDSLIYLGLDGLLVGTSENNYAKISKDGYELRYTDTGSTGESGAAFRMNNSGFQRAYKLDSNRTPVNWVAFDGYSNVTKLTASDFTSSTFYYGNTQVTALNYIVQPNDVNIFIAQNTTGSGDLYIRLTDGCGGESISQQASSSTLMPGRKLFIRNLSGRTVFICAGSTGSHQFLLTREGLDKEERENIANNNYAVMTVPTCTFDGGINYCDWAIIQRN